MDLRQSYLQQQCTCRGGAVNALCLTGKPHGVGCQNPRQAKDALKRRAGPVYSWSVSKCRVSVGCLTLRGDCDSALPHTRLPALLLSPQKDAFLDFRALSSDCL